MRQADKQTESLFCGRVGFYNLKLKRKGFYTPPCPIFKYPPRCYTECVGALYKELSVMSAKDTRHYTQIYWILSFQMDKELTRTMKSAGTEALNQSMN